MSQKFNPDHHRVGTQSLQRARLHEEGTAGCGNKVVFIADSKTPTNVSEVCADRHIAATAFRDQDLAGPGSWLFPSSRKPTDIRWSSRRHGKEPCDALVYRTSGCTMRDPGTPPGWVQARGRMNGLRKCSNKLMGRCSRKSRMKLQMKPEALDRLNGRGAIPQLGTVLLRRAITEPVLIRYEF